LNTFNALGVTLAVLQLTMALLVMLSIPTASKRGSGWLAAMYAVVGFATVVWIMRAALWQA
jgi:hypothetical protein